MRWPDLSRIKSILKSVFGEVAEQVRYLLPETPPSLPAPFSAVSEWVNEFVLKPVTRSLNEAASGAGLIYEQLYGIYTNRDWYITRLRIKFSSQFTAFSKLLDQSISLIEQAVDDVKNKLSGDIESVKERIAGALGAIGSDWVIALSQFKSNFDIVWNRIKNVSAETFSVLNSWVTYYKYKIEWLCGTAYDWFHAMYNAYRVNMDSFFSNPVLFMIDQVEKSLYAYAQRIASLSARLLEHIW